MIDCRAQIYDALKTITENVKMSSPEGAVSFPLITYAEITNTYINQREDIIEFQIDGYESSFEELMILMRDIDEVMTGLGWHRNYITPDTRARQSKDFYKKSANYVARVDTLWKNILGGI